MDDLLDLMSPYRQSFAYDDTEKALQSLFIDVFNELFAEQISDIHHYGMPHLGSAKVVERFTKQDGLVVLRRPTSSDLIMRVIYANWRSLASRRGLAFLEFVLQMIWSDQWKIQRLYHSKERANLYPALVTPEPTRDSFLTSRITIVLDQNVDAAEVLELAPIISKLVPANIVTSISLGMELGEMDIIATGGAFVANMVGNFQYFDRLSSMRIPWTDWIIRRDYSLIGDQVRYNGSQTDLMSIFQSYAVINLRPYALTAMSNAAFHTLAGVFKAVQVLHPNADSCEADPATKKIKVSIFPALLDDLAAAAIIKTRVELSNNGAFTGNAYFPALMRKMGWAFIEGGFYYSIPADLILRSPLMYTVADIKGYESHLDTAQQHIADLVANDAEWVERTLQDLVLKGSDVEVHVFVQHYTVPAELPPFDVYEVDPSVTRTDGIAHYTGYQTNSVQFYDSYADLNLTDAIIRSLSDTDMQLLQAVTDAANELTGVADWTFDTANQQVKYMELEEELTVPFHLIADQIILNLTSSNTEIPAFAETYLEAVADSIFDEDESKQFVKLSDLAPLFEANAVLREQDPALIPDPVAMTYEFAVVQVENPDFVSVDASDYLPVEHADLVNVFVDLRAKAIAEDDALLLQNLNNAVKSAYRKDPLWTATNNLYNATLIDESFLNVVNQIFNGAANASASQYPSAHEYLSKVVETIFSANGDDQLIKLADLIPQFENNKIKKTL